MSYDITEKLKGKINDEDIDEVVQLFAKEIRLNKIHCEIMAKYKCNNCNNKDCITMVPNIPKATSKIMFIGEKPTQIEGNDHLPYIDSGGAMFQIILNKLGKNPNDMYMTYLQKCFSVNNTEVDCIAAYMEREIKCLNPKLIVLFGDNCFKTFTDFFEITEIEHYPNDIEKFNVKVLDTEYAVLKVSDPNAIELAVGVRSTGIKNKFWQDMNNVFVYFDKL